MLFFPFQPTGHFRVGIRDFAFSDGELDPIKHCVGRVFYPASPHTGQSFFGRLFSWCTWLPHRCYAKGYSQFLFFFFRADRSWRILLARLGVQAVLTIMGFCCGLSATYNAPLWSGSDAEGRAGQAESDETKELRFPLVLFSHGLAGTRNTYSSICIQLASEGFIVVAVEHADGSASTVRLAPELCCPSALQSGSTEHPNEWMFYGGLGDELAQVRKTRWRVEELRTARRLFEAMHHGHTIQGLWVSGTDISPVGKGFTSQAGAWLHGRIDLSRVSAAGHSYGGATVALAAAEHYPEFKAAVAMDPWWGGLPPDCSILSSGTWKSRSPCLILGSHAWNVPGPATGKLPCNGERQEALLKAAVGGPGALLVVCRGSNHHSYDDVLLFFGKLMAPLLALFNFKSTLHPRKALDQVCSCTSHFLQTHLSLPQGPGPVAEAGTPALEAPLPVKQAHADAYKRMCPGDELFILRACASS